MDIPTSLKWASILSTAIFTGAAIGINVGGMPAINSIKNAKARVTSWGTLYKNIAGFQASLAILAFSSSIALWRLGHGNSWRNGGLLIASVVPFTIFVIAPQANNKLFAIEEKLQKTPDDSVPSQDEEEIDRLLNLWSWLHGVRSVASLLALITLTKPFIH